MEFEFLKTLGQIAGLGGIVVGVVLILFRQIIQKNIFPNLTKDQSFKILRLIIMSVLSIAILGICAWTIISLKVKENANQTNIKNIDTTSYMRGIVRDSATGYPVENAKIAIDVLPDDTNITTSDGGFYIKNIPAKLGERVRLYVSKKGYKDHNEYITIPGPVIIIMKQVK